MRNENRTVSSVLDRRGALLLALLALALGAGGVRVGAFAASGPSGDPGRSVLPFRAERAPILFSGGELAAWECEARSIACDAGALRSLPEAEWARIERRLRVAAGTLRAHAQAGGSGRWVERWINPARAARIERERLSGISVRGDPRRVYPEGRLACHLLGGCGYDAQGLYGVERAWNGALAGLDGTVPVRCDARRRAFWPAGAEPPSGREGLVLSLDYEVQVVLEEEIDRAVVQWDAPRALAIAMDPATGAVLGLAARPAYDPNDLREIPAERLWNPAVGWSFEPGSTAKPFVYAEALAEGVVTARTVLDCENGAWRVGYRTLHDHHPYELLAAHDVIVKSSNIGAAKIGSALGPERVRRAMARWGFGERTGLGLSGEEPGVLHPLRMWRRDTAVSVPIGHEMATTPIQLLCAYAAIANGGTRVRPYLVRSPAEARWPDGVRGPAPGGPPLPASVLEEVRAALRDVVASGTGRLAAVPGVAVAGKTGTAQNLAPDGTYLHDSHLCLFVGYAPVGHAPAESPSVCLLVAIDDPKPQPATGGRVCAPVAGRILARILERRGGAATPPSDDSERIPE